MALEYKRARKKKKGKIIDSVVQLTDYNRSYAARGLRWRARPKAMGRGKVGGANTTLVADERKRKKSQKTKGKSEEV